MPSLASACKWKESKQLHREHDGPRAWLRHSPGFRRQNYLKSAAPPPAPLVATSKTQAQAAAAAVAAGASPEEAAVTAQQHLLKPRHPRQLMPIFTDLMLTAVILCHAALLLNEKLVGFGDDESDCFHQFCLMLQQIWACGIELLDPDDVAASVDNPRLASFLEWCMSMGTPPSSGYAQRWNTELGNYFEASFHALESEYIPQLRRDVPKFDAFCRAREALDAAGSSLRAQFRLLVCLFYADDPVILVVGVKRCARAVVHWTRTMGPRAGSTCLWVNQSSARLEWTWAGSVAACFSLAHAGVRAGEEAASHACGALGRVAR